MVAVIRQLAEAERSPVTTIKEQYQASVRDQIRQPPRHVCGVRQFQLRCESSRDGNVDHDASLTPLPTRAFQYAAGRNGGRIFASPFPGTPSGLRSFFENRFGAGGFQNGQQAESRDGRDVMGRAEPVEVGKPRYQQRSEAAEHSVGDVIGE